jgi:hypothetical protein
VLLSRTVAPEQQDEGWRAERSGDDADGEFTVWEQESGACVGGYKKGRASKCRERSQPADRGMERQPDEVGNDEADEGDGACEGDRAGDSERACGEHLHAETDKVDALRGGPLGPGGERLQRAAAEG